MIFFREKLIFESFVVGLFFCLRDKNFVISVEFLTLIRISLTSSFQSVQLQRGSRQQEWIRILSGFIHRSKVVMQVGGSIALWLEYLLPDPTAPGLIPSIPEFFSDYKIIHIAEVNQWHWLYENVIWLENVDPSHL